MVRVLLTDGLLHKTLAAARSLAQHGYQVAAADPDRLSLTRYSRFCHSGLFCPRPEDREAYWQWLLDVQKQQGLDVLIPMDDQTTELAVARQDRLPYRTLLPSPKQYAVGRFKALTAALALEAGVRAPRTAPAATEAEALAALADFGGSVVIKAVTSSGGRGLFFADSPEAVQAAWHKARPEWGGFIVQERIPLGRKFDVCLLFGPGGDPVASFVQQELRWFPREYGASTLQESVHRPDLVDLTLRLLRPIGWRGPVEAEYMEDPEGRPVLMEINPRYWASLALALRCGVHFPALHAALARGETVRGPATYPAGVRCRWLIPADLLHFLTNPDRWHMQPGFFSPYDERTFDAILSRDDPGAAFGLLLTLARHVFSPAMWRVLMRW